MPTSQTSLAEKAENDFMGDLHFHIATTLGLVLAVCLAAGVFADLLHLPKVTAYLLVGMLVGPSVLDWVPQEHVELFEPVLKLAIAIVLFNLGCEFTFTKVRRVAAHCLALSAAEILATFGLVTVGLVLFGSSGSKALLLGCLAVATAPATTILVLKEFRSEGPVTESTGFLVAINNFACIVMFEFAFLAVQLMQGNLEGSFGQRTCCGGSRYCRVDRVGRRRWVGCQLRLRAVEHQALACTVGSGDDILAGDQRLVGYPLHGDFSGDGGHGGQHVGLHVKNR